LRVELEKPDGGVRLLGIPTVLDRFIQQPAIDPTCRLGAVLRPSQSRYAHGSVGETDRGDAGTRSCATPTIAMCTWNRGGRRSE
jgi:hypothetical protein